MSPFRLPKARLPLPRNDALASAPRAMRMVWGDDPASVSSRFSDEYLCWIVFAKGRQGGCFVGKCWSSNRDLKNKQNRKLQKKFRARMGTDGHGMEEKTSFQNTEERRSDKQCWLKKWLVPQFTPWVCASSCVWTNSTTASAASWDAKYPPVNQAWQWGIPV